MPKKGGTTKAEASVPCGDRRLFCIPGCGPRKGTEDDSRSDRQTGEARVA